MSFISVMAVNGLIAIQITSSPSARGPSDNPWHIYKSCDHREHLVTCSVDMEFLVLILPWPYPGYEGDLLGRSWLAVSIRFQRNVEGPASPIACINRPPPQWRSLGLFSHKNNEMDSVVTVSKHTHTHTQPFYGRFSGTTQVSRCQKNLKKCLLLDFIVQGEREAHTPTVRVVATLFALISNHPHPSFLRWMPFLPQWAIYPGLGQAPNMLVCILPKPRFYKP